MEERRGKVWLEEICPYSAEGVTARLWPFSFMVMRLATRLRLVIVTHGVEVACGRLMPGELLVELEACYWLLTAPREEVRSLFRREHVEVDDLLSIEIPPGEFRAFEAELVRVLRLLEYSMFLTEPRDSNDDDDGITDGQLPPDNRYEPADDASLVLSLAKELGESPESLLWERPASQVVQLLHCVQWGNQKIWTVKPSIDSGQPAVDPLEDVEIEMDEGYGVEVAF